MRIRSERAVRRLSPLASSLRTSLALPEPAPSRVRLALQTPSGPVLEAMVGDARRGRLGSGTGEAAERILELVGALDRHDRRTRGHSERVRGYSRVIGERMGLDDDDLDRLEWAGLLHDVGKLLVPAAILAKRGPLTDAEFAIVQQHPEHGRALVAPLTPWLGDAARAVWEHHERWDGAGYPRGIAEEDISLFARIVSVADAFDVITSTRSYTRRRSRRAARAELVRCAGTQFDPAVVSAFVAGEIGTDRWATTRRAAIRERATPDGSATS